MMVSPLPLNQRLHFLLLLLFFDFQPCVLSTNALRQQSQVVLTEPHLDVADKYTESLNSSWNFNFSSQAPHLFASAQGLLQQWPNTFFPNGHSIVPCEVPAYTNLYHGRRDDDLPPSPEWFAFDMYGLILISMYSFASGLCCSIFYLPSLLPLFAAQANIFS
jgi:hypothetical protein